LTAGSLCLIHHRRDCRDGETERFARRTLAASPGWRYRTAPAFSCIEASLERHADAIVGTAFIVVGGLVAADAAIRLDLLPTS